MREAISHSVFDVMDMRVCSREEALAALASSYEENVSLSLGTAFEGYWRLMLECVQGELGVTRGETEFGIVRSLPRGDR
jgi:hypothetical protein